MPVMHVQDVLPRDAIPGIDDPTFGSDYIGQPDDEVVVVDGDPPRAYPVRILSHHEIVNTAVSGTDAVTDGRPVAVTWCPICASAAVYDRTVGARVLTFGTSGKLADDALVMYDRETETEWKQPSGRAIAGPLAGHELTALPAPLLTWERFQRAYPDGEVLQPVRGPETDPHGRSAEAIYDMTPYDRYDAAEAFGLREMRGEGRVRTWDREDIGAKTTVLGIVSGDGAVGYPVPQVETEGGLVTDSVGGLDIVVVASEGIHAYVAPPFELTLADGRGRLAGDGTTWDPATGRADDGRRLERVPTRRLYAFAWQDDHGPDSFYGLG